MKKFLTLMCVGALLASGSGLVALADENAPETLVEATELVQDQPTEAEALVSENEADELVEGLSADTEKKPENLGDDLEDEPIDEPVDNPIDEPEEPTDPIDTPDPSEPIGDDEPIEPTKPSQPGLPDSPAPVDLGIPVPPVAPATSTKAQVAVAPSSQEQKLTTLPATGETSSASLGLLGVLMLLGTGLFVKTKKQE